MKRIISAALSVVMLSSVVGCTAKPTEVAESSSEFARFESYLSVMDCLPDNLITGTAESSEKYGVDMTSFAEDGFITRANDGNVVILGKTEKGIDRAVRDYAKYGNEESYYKVYNEGYRVKKLTICGNDIENYAVVHEDSVENNIVFARDELIGYIEKTCGAKLFAYSESEYDALSEKPEHIIRIAVDYPLLSDEGFSIAVDENGDLSILGGRFRGCVYGVYDFLEEIGWRFISGPTWYDENGDMKATEYLYESEHIDITAKSNRTEYPAMASRIPSDFGTFCGAYASRLSNSKVRDDLSEKNRANQYSKINQHGLIGVANHGLQGGYVLNKYGYGTDFSVQPCYSDEEIIEAITDYSLKTVQKRLDAGQQIGREFSVVDIAQYDTTDFCTCKSCMKIKKEEGSNSGAIVRMANTVAKALAESYDGVDVYILAYAGSNVPPAKTKPLDNVRVSYCFYIGNARFCCNRHCIDGSGSDTCPNKDYAGDFNGWVDICKKGNVSVWYYPMPCGDISYQPGYIDTVYYDMMYLLESDVQALMIEIGPETGGVLNGLVTYLTTKMMWDGEMTKEEYDSLIEEWFNISYGDAGGECYEYFRINEIAGKRVDCYTVFHGGKGITVDNEYFADKFDYMWDLFKRAEADADTSFQEKLVGIYEAGMVYMCIGITHTDRYLNGTEEQREVIAERYRWLHEFSLENNVSFVEESLGTLAYTVPEVLNLNDNPFDTWTPDFDEYRP